MNPAKIVIVTTGQPSTNPRMMKEVEALSEAGYQIKVLYSHWAAWGMREDKPLLDRYPGIFHLVGGDPVDRRWTYFFSRLIHKMSRMLGKYFPGLRGYAIVRASYFLERAAIREKADLYIGHNLGALPAVVKAAKKWHARSGFDAEDYHRGQLSQTTGNDYHFTVYVEEKFMPGCDYLTAASPLIAKAYEDLLPGKKVAVINNVFSAGHLQRQVERKAGPLRLFWFSQSVGSDRGLEVVVDALNLLSECEIELHLMGDCADTYRQQLTARAKRPQALHFLPPVAPDKLFSSASAYDIGLAGEMPYQENRDRCLTNKIFTYLLAGNCILASDTRAQRQFMETNPGIGWLYRYDDPKDLAERIAAAYKDPEALLQCRRRCLSLAANRYNWEFEKEIFLEQVKNVLK